MKYILLIISGLLLLVGCGEPTINLSKKSLMIVYDSGYLDGLMNRTMSDSIKKADSLEYVKFLGTLKSFK